VWPILQLVGPTAPDSARQQSVLRTGLYYRIVVRFEAAVGTANGTVLQNRGSIPAAKRDISPLHSNQTGTREPGFRVLYKVPPPFGKTLSLVVSYSASNSLSVNSCTSRPSGTRVKLGPQIHFSTGANMAPGTDGQETDQWPSSGDEVNNAWSYNSTPPIHHRIINDNFITSLSQCEIWWYQDGSQAA